MVSPGPGLSTRMLAFVIWQFSCLTRYGSQHFKTVHMVSPSPPSRQSRRRSDSTGCSLPTTVGFHSSNIFLTKSYRNIYRFCWLLPVLSWTFWALNVRILQGSSKYPVSNTPNSQILFTRNFLYMRQWFSFTGLFPKVYGVEICKNFHPGVGAFWQSPWRRFLDLCLVKSLKNAFFVFS